MTRCGTEPVDTVSIDNGEMTRDGDGQLDDDGGDARSPVNERNVHEAGTQASNVDGEVNPTIVLDRRHGISEVTNVQHYRRVGSR
jgi:hypothetical protein